RDGHHPHGRSQPRHRPGPDQDREQGSAHPAGNGGEGSVPGRTGRPASQGRPSQGWRGIFTMTADVLIRLSDVAKPLTKAKQTLSIFEALTMDIPRQDFFAIMGPSGSGKTTLLNLLGGLDRPSAGSVTFDGTRIDKLSESKLSAWRAANVGFIFQFYNLM